MELISELSEYLDVLSSPVRLHILSFLGKKPRTIRQAAHEIGTSEEDAKKHLLRLLSLGIIRKEMGISQDQVNRGQPVFYYSLEPGSPDRLIMSMRVFSTITAESDPALHHQVQHAIQGLNDVFPLAFPSLTMRNGPDCGRVYLLTAEIYRIGREESGWDVPGPESVVLINGAYQSVRRISGPHAWLIRRNGTWMIRDGESKGGTFLGGKKVSGEDQIVLTDGAMIELGQDPLGASLVFTMIADEGSD